MPYHEWDFDIRALSRRIDALTKRVETLESRCAEECGWVLRHPTLSDMHFGEGDDGLGRALDAACQWTSVPAEVPRG